MFSKSSRRILGTTAALALAGALSLGIANADQIFIQQSGSSAAGGDPNILTNLNAFTIGASGGTFTLQNPLLVIVGVYNGSGTPSIDFSSSACMVACPSATIGTYGLTANIATFTSGVAWDQLGLSGGNSESFTNWSAADIANGLPAPTSFTLYAFAIDTSLSSGSPITVSESGAAIGSFIIAYSCQDGTGTSSGCNTPGDVAQTIFTNSGYVGTTIPEPGVLALFGAGLLGCALVMGRRARQS